MNARYQSVLVMVKSLHVTRVMILIMLVMPMRKVVIMMVTMLQALSHVIYFPVGFATKPLPALGRHAGTPLGSLTLHETMVTMDIIVSWSSPWLSWSPWS